MISDRTDSLDTGYRIAEERDFLLTRLQAAFEHDTSLVGVSSNAMILQAMTGEDEPRAWPHDQYDLARCEKTYRLAPDHLQRKMKFTLERFRTSVSTGRSGR